MDKKTVDSRNGANSILVARLWIIIILCIFQFWLFSVALEAFQYKKTNIIIYTSIISFICFVINCWIMIKGEKSKN